MGARRKDSGDARAAGRAVEAHYIDAFGNRHAVPRRTLKAIADAIGDSDEADDAVLVVAEGERLEVGRAELVLEKAALPRRIAKALNRR